MSKKLTQGILVEAESFYVPEQSSPEENHYFFSYRIQIKNESDQKAQLLNRHWIITDGHGRIHEVKGPGVIGKQPELEPGQSFEYESFCPLETPTGLMKGFYEMKSSKGDSFLVEIPAFFLVEPSSFQ